LPQKIAPVEERENERTKNPDKRLDTANQMAKGQLEAKKNKLLRR
jgi:hypothetical protein